MSSDFVASTAPSSASVESGLLLVDKPRGVTSHDVVAAVRSVLRMRRVGHAGTLDPMATGLLLVGFGRGTRLLRAAMGSDKTYAATIRLGVSTTTDDADGDVVAVTPVTVGAGRVSVPASDADGASVSFRSSSGPDGHDEPGSTASDHRKLRHLDREAIESVVRARLVGRISQVPSRFSAIRVQGRHAYDRARNGEDFTLDPRTVEIRSFRVGEPEASTMTVDGAVTPVVDVDVRVDCSSGTYVRSLARDLGELLGVGGHLVALRRVRVGAFDVDESSVVTASADIRTVHRRDGGTQDVAIARVKGDAEDLRRHALPLASVAARLMPVLEMDAGQARDLRFGRSVSCPEDASGPMAAVVRSGDAVGGETRDDLVALVEPSEGRAKPTVVFPADPGMRTESPAAETGAVNEGEER